MMNGSDLASTTASSPKSKEDQVVNGHDEKENNPFAEYMWMENEEDFNRQDTRSLLDACRLPETSPRAWPSTRLPSPGCREAGREGPPELQAGWAEGFHVPTAPLVTEGGFRQLYWCSQQKISIWSSRCSAKELMVSG
ncbi:polyadenylate-binding protein-interacting protein 2B isoform 1-T1 [Ciconia maguari]